MGEQTLKKGINRALDDGCKEISRKTIRVYGENNWLEINAQLADWERRGFLKILISPENAADEDICVVMLKYIDRESPLPGKWP